MNINININNVTINLSSEQPATEIADALVSYAKAHIRHKKINRVKDVYERRRNDSDDALKQLEPKIIWENFRYGGADDRLRTQCKVWTIRRMVAERMLEEL